MSSPCMDIYRILPRRKPQTLGEQPISFVCLRPEGHLGDHWAKGFGGRIVKRWSR